MSVRATSGNISNPPDFHNACTVCGGIDNGCSGGKRLQLTCLSCRSQTHRQCSQAPAAVAAAFAAELGLDTLVSVARSIAAAATSGAASSTGHNHQHSQQQQQPLQQEVFFCCADCAVSLSIFPNPNFCPDLSATVKSDMHARWRALVAEAQVPPRQIALFLSTLPQPERRAAAVTVAVNPNSSGGVEGHGTNASTASANTESRVQDATACINEGDHDSDINSTQLALRAAYLQLRFEAWHRYFILERATVSAVPPLLPPSTLSVSEDVIEYVSELVSAEGQAERLYMLGVSCDGDGYGASDPVPIGSLVALPPDAVWWSAKPLTKGETNNFLAEAAERVATTAVTPATFLVLDLFKSDE